MKQDADTCLVLFRKNNIPTLLAICEFVSEKLGENVTPISMAFTIDLLKASFYKGNRKRVTGFNHNPWGRKGKCTSN